MKVEASAGGVKASIALCDVEGVLGGGVVALVCV